MAADEFPIGLRLWRPFRALVFGGMLIPRHRPGGLSFGLCSGDPLGHGEDVRNDEKGCVLV